MDHLPNPCPPSPTSSDSDEYNTETARVYFGPVKTPERKFVAASQGLFPPPDRAGPLRRSPRLSSPRLRSVSPMEPESAQTDNDDLDQVELLVNASDEEDSGDLLDSGAATPQKGDDTIDEPSSALADKILHAHDNPSPPPSPPSTLRIFDPYHTTATEATNDYQADLMFLNLSDRMEGHGQPLLLHASTGTTDNETHPPNRDDPVVNYGELIPVDLVEPPTPSSVIRAGSLFPPNLTLSVDDLLSKSPSPQKVHSSEAQHTVPVVVVEPSDNNVPMVSEAPQSDLQTATDDKNVNAEVPVVQRDGQVVGDSKFAEIETENAAATPEHLAVTPLRRSTRPRRSITPNMSRESPPVPPSTILPSSATKVRRKQATANPKDEVVSDSQDEVESRPLAAEQATTSTVRVRHRSPAKNLPSFSRELGSLSPTSSNLLSTLNFTAPDAHTENASFSVPSSSGTPMLSFSVFTPPTDTAAPSTPVRSSGPIRFSSTTKIGASASPTKFTLQPPAPNDPTNTPARRVPVSQAVAEGRMSPEKNIQSGFHFSNTPLPSVPTPARRVLISEGPPSMAVKASTMRLASPTRSLAQRAPSAEPKLGPSVKGKGKATQSTQESVGAIAKLPFPIVAAAAAAATSTTAEGSTAGAKPTKQDDLAKAEASPAKSSLRQSTSRIPRIGSKPYARAAETKVPDKPKPMRKVESVVTIKPLPKSATSETASSLRKNIRTVEALTAPTASTSRVKPAIVTTSTVLKRKREQDKSSPVKPRIVRQVPQIVAPMAPAPQPAPLQAATLDTASKAKKAATGPRQIRRVVDPEPPRAELVQQHQPTSPPHSEQTVPLANDTAADVPVLSIPEVIVSLASESVSIQQPLDLNPGSPMKQDPPPPASQPPSQVTVDPPAFNIIPEIMVDAGDSGLRRTTRSKRAPIRDVFTEGSSRPTSTRRKPVNFHSDDVFSGMSMTALKDLTVSNTVKNQKYLTVQLETEIVRREGLRPESPAVKIRTIVQRQQDERERRVKERAKRREGRSDGGMSDLDCSSDIEINDPGDSSQIDELIDDVDRDLRKHTRGAGDDDDYVTPEKVKRNYQGTRLFVDGNDEQQEEPAPQRRVKWDRGLFTTVYLDEVKLGSRQYLKENRDLKGILAPTAKAIRLDTLGNHPHAEAPLADIVPENVMVKKIVYDDDEAPAAPAVTPKPTRAKSKRK